MPGDNVPAWLIAPQISGPDQLLKSADGWCAALDRRTMSCGIYQQRPSTCRKFSMGGAYCMDERKQWTGQHQPDVSETGVSPSRPIAHTLLPAANPDAQAH